VFGDGRLSRRARTFIDQAGYASHRIAVSVISLAEIVYLIEKKRLLASDYEDLTRVLDDPEHVLAVAPVTPGVIDSMRLVPRDAVPDMPDRIVAATALHLGVPVISRDGCIRASTIETIW
jgi:PIN domain nuclease of toxin-antitoxin system